MIKEWLQDWLKITPGEIRVRFEEPTTLTPELIPEGSTIALTYPGVLSDRWLRCIQDAWEKQYKGTPHEKVLILMGGLELKAVEYPTLTEDILAVVAKDIAMRGTIYKSIKQITGA